LQRANTPWRTGGHPFVYLCRPSAKSNRPKNETSIGKTTAFGWGLDRDVARYCGLELKEDGSPNNLLLARASLWAPSGSQVAIERRLLLTHNIEPDLSDLIRPCVRRKKDRMT